MARKTGASLDAGFLVQRQENTVDDLKGYNVYEAAAGRRVNSTAIFCLQQLFFRTWQAIDQ